ncbi:MAG: hypothetical protein EXQ88_03055 [Alphaproteobacteria bacterium]|nr:hypothetical protein [Alphaproteobacteria bacterium]
MTWHCDFDGELSAELTFNAVDVASAYMDFSHVTRSNPEQAVRYRVRLTTTRPHYGGLRWWFVCPSSGRRVHKLFLPLGGHRFLSRDAYQLGFACQRESRRDRLARRARKLDRALGGAGEVIGDDLPPKPKGMWWRSYVRKLAALEEAQSRADGAWFDGMPVRLRRAIGAAMD